MRELDRIGTRANGGPGPAGLGDIFGVGNGDRAHAEVNSGLHDEKLPVAGMSVGAIRAQFASRLQIEQGALAYINAHVVDEETIVGEGVKLTFQRASGEKG